MIAIFHYCTSYDLFMFQKIEIIRCDSYHNVSATRQVFFPIGPMSDNFLGKFVTSLLIANVYNIGYISFRNSAKDQRIGSRTV